MNMTERERPIRLTFAGEVESYDWQTAQWIRDKSRDPRELIPLSYPPAADAYLYLQKTTCVNAIAHAFKYLASLQSTQHSNYVSDVDQGVNQVWYTFYDFTNQLGYNSDNKDRVFILATYQVALEWWKVDLDTAMTTAFWEKLVCHLWCHISDDCTFTYENWLALIQAIYDDSTLGDATQWLKLMVIACGRKGLANLGFLKNAETIVLDPETDCTCT